MHARSFANKCGPATNLSTTTAQNHNATSSINTMWYTKPMSRSLLPIFQSWHKRSCSVIHNAWGHPSPEILRQMLIAKTTQRSKKGWHDLSQLRTNRSFSGKITKRSINMSVNYMTTKHTKHIDMKHHVIRYRCNRYFFKAIDFTYIDIRHELVPLCHMYTKMITIDKNGDHGIFEEKSVCRPRGTYEVFLPSLRN